MERHRFARAEVGPGWCPAPLRAPDRPVPDAPRRRPPDAPSRQAGGRRHLHPVSISPAGLGTLWGDLVIAIASRRRDGARAGIQLSGRFGIQLSNQVMSWRPCRGRTSRSGRLSIGPSSRRLVSICSAAGQPPISRSRALANRLPCPLGELKILVGWIWSTTTPTAASRGAHMAGNEAPVRSIGRSRAVRCTFTRSDSPIGMATGVLRSPVDVEEARLWAAGSWALRSWPDRGRTA
jgi:hypothetical protein